MTLIDWDREDCERIAGRIKATVLHGDGTDPAMLGEAGAYGADVVLAISAKDQDNLAACQLARMQFEVPRAIALVNDPDNQIVTRSMCNAFVTRSRDSARTLPFGSCEVSRM